MNAVASHIDNENWANIVKFRGLRPDVVARINRQRAEADQAELAQRAEADQAELAQAQTDMAVAKMKLRHAPAWVIKLVLSVAKERGHAPFEIIGPCRTYQVVRARHEAFYRIKEAKPSLSMPRIAGWFARDHTTIMHGIAAYAQAHGLPSLSGYNLTAARARNRITALARHNDKKGLRFQ